MPKYLVQGSYTAEGLKGVQKDGGSGRREAISKAFEAPGGKLESFYFVFGDEDVVGVADFPDNITAAAMALSISTSGLVRTKVTVLLTAEEVDRAVKKTIGYRAPGK